MQLTFQSTGENTLLNPEPDSRNLWRYALFNVALTILLGLWFFTHNQPVAILEPTLAADGKLQCVSYAPYYGKQQTPLLPYTRISRAQIEHDLQLLSRRFSCVRTYSVSQGLDHVPEAASRLGLKVMLGAWIGYDKLDNDKELALAIRLANQHPASVSALIVGNEVLLRREQTQAQMQAYLERAQLATEVPVTYADVWEYWRKHQALETTVDFVTVHILPYWEDIPRSIDDAQQHARNVMTKLDRDFSKPLFIGETGWPSTGRQRGASVPSSLNQARYIREFAQSAAAHGWRYNIIEAIDQPWKRQLEGTVGGHWGLYGTDLEPKFDFSGPLAERNDDYLPWLYAASGLVLLLGCALAIQERRKSALLAVAALGAVSGLCFMLQLQYLLAAVRDSVDFIALGSLTLAGNMIVLGMPFIIGAQVRRQAGQPASSIMSLSWLVLLAGAAIAGWLLAFDGRYRNFPLMLFALPALQLAVGLQLLQNPLKALWPQANYVLALAALSTALAVSLLEPNNSDAWCWLLLVALLAYGGGFNASLTQWKKA